MFSFVKPHPIDENVSINCVTICATHGYCQCSKLLWVRVVLYSQQHNEVYEVNAFYAEVFSFFMSHGHLALNVTSGNSSDQWAFTMLETEVFKYRFLNISQTAVYCVEICTVDVR